MDHKSLDKLRVEKGSGIGWRDHAAVLLALTVAPLIWLSLAPVLGNGSPFVIFLGAVASVAWFGRTAGALATTVGGAVLTWLLSPSNDPPAWPGIALYLLVATIVVAMGRAMQRPRGRLSDRPAETFGQPAGHDSIEAARWQSHEQLAAAMESVTDGFVRYDRDWRIVYVNAEAERMNHLSRDEVIGKTLWDIFPAVVGTRLESEFRRAVAEQVTVDFENNYEPWGRWYALKAYPTPDGGLTTFIRDITEQKAQRDALVASEARFRELADAMPQIVYACAADGQVEFVNRQWFEYTGQDGAQKSDLGAVAHPEDLPGLVRQWEACRAAGTTLQAEFRLRRATDGAFRWFLTRTVPLRDAAGQIVKWFGTSTDIHDQKLTEQRLIESEARYRAIGESMEFGVWVCDASGRNTYASESFLRMVGMTQEQCSDFGWGAVLHPDDAEATIEAWKECVKRRGTWDRVHRFKGVDGTWYSVLARGVPLRDAAGEMLGWAGINLDITRLVQTEQEVVRIAAESERQRRLYETVLSSTPDFVYVFSLDHRVLYANESLIQMWGRGHEGAIGKTFLEIGYEPWHAAMHDREIDQVRATRQPIRGEVPFSGTLGTRQYEYIFVPVVGADGEVEAVAGTTRDITDRRQAEEQLRSNEARQSFLVLLADAIRPLSDPVAVQAEASRVLGQRLGANRVVYFEARGDDYVVEQDYTDAAPSVVGRHSIASFGAEQLALYQAGQTASESDVDAHPSRTVGEKEAFAAVQIRSYVGVPLVKGGVFVAGLAVHATRVRDWDATEIAIIEDTAERTWAAVEQARIEAALRQSEERSAFVRRSSGVGFWYCDLPFDVLQWDELVKAHFHLPPDATVTIQTFYERIHPDEREPTRLAIESSIGGRTNYNVDYRTVHPDSGAVTWVRAIGRTVYAADGTPKRFDGVTLDVSEQKRAEASLRQSEERRRLALDAAELGAWHIDPGSNSLSTDERFRMVFAGSSDPIDYKQAIAAVHPDDRQRVVQAVAAAMRADDPAPYAEEYRVRHRDGSIHWVFAKGRANYDCREPQRLLSFDGTIADITERKRIEEERERLIGQLRDADRRKDVFLATLAHELRNPLAPIRNGLQLIRMAGATGPVEQARSMMERQLVQITRLVDDLLDAGRVTTGKLELRRERLELRLVIAAALETSLPVIEQEGHELAVVLPDEAIFVDGDPIRLAQVVSNLLINSARYTRRGGHIRVSVARADSTAIVAVADNGVGIPAAMLDTVFEMFTQVDRSLEKAAGGLGIGLSLSRGLVEMHGGTITARSDGVGKGSEFVVRLPIATGAASARATGDGDGDGDGATHAGPPTAAHRILIVDDNVDFANSLSLLLGMLGNEVRTVYDGEAGIEAARAFRPGVVLCDIGMPKVNGYDAARRIRAEAWTEGLVLVALSGWGQEGDLLKSRQAGFDHHLVKPVDAAALTKLLAGLQPVAA